MVDKLIALADELDKLGEKQAASMIDNLIKSAVGKGLPPLEPEANEFDDEEVTKTDIEPLPPLKDLLEEQRQKLERTFGKEKPKGVVPKKDDPRDMINDVVKMLVNAEPHELEMVKERAISLLEKARNAMH